MIGWPMFQVPSNESRGSDLALCDPAFVASIVVERPTTSTSRGAGSFRSAPRPAPGRARLLTSSSPAPGRGQTLPIERTDRGG